MSQINSANDEEVLVDECSDIDGDDNEREAMLFCREILT